MKKTFVFLVIFFEIVGCVHTTKVGFLPLKNDTDNVVLGKYRQTGQSNLGDDFALQPKEELPLVQYDVSPGDEVNILNQIEAIQIQSDECTIILDKKSIQSLVDRDSPSIVIQIKPELFGQCEWSTLYAVRGLVLDSGFYFISDNNFFNSGKVISSTG